MADVEVNMKLNASELKKGIKDAKNEIAKADFGSAAYDKATKSLQKLQEAMGDVTDQAKIQGSGVERLESSFGLLQEGFLKADPGKIGLAFKGLGQAMEAVPIFLLIEGFKILADNFDTVKDIVKEVFGAFSDGELAVRGLTKELEKQKEINKTLIPAMENEIKILEAQGASNEKILAKKKEINAIKIRELEIDARLQLSRIQEIKDNDTLVEAYYRKAAAVLTYLGQEQEAETILKLVAVQKSERAKEAIDKFKQDTIAIQDLKTEIIIADIKNDKENEKRYKDNAKKKSDDEKARLEEAKKLQAEEADRQNAIIDRDEANAKKLEDGRAKSLEDLKALQLKADQDEVAAFIEKERQMTAAKKAESDERYALEKQNVQTAQIFSDIYFQSQIDAAAGNEAKQLEIKKRAFEVNKAFQASQATIDGVRATLSAYATAPPGFKIAAAVSAGLFAAAQVAKILKAKFNAGGATSAPIGNVTSGGGGGEGAPLGGQIQQGSTSSQSSTTFDQNGKQSGNWISVVEINSTQKRVAKMSEQARF